MEGFRSWILNELQYDEYAGVGVGKGCDYGAKCKGDGRGCKLSRNDGVVRVSARRGGAVEFGDKHKGTSSI